MAWRCICSRRTGIFLSQTSYLIQFFSPNRPTFLSIRILFPSFYAYAYACLYLPMPAIRPRSCPSLSPLFPFPSSDFSTNLLSDPIPSYKDPLISTSFKRTALFHNYDHASAISFPIVIVLLLPLRATRSYPCCR